MAARQTSAVTPKEELELGNKCMTSMIDDLQKLSQASPQTKCTMFRVPGYLKALESQRFKRYSPELLSLGLFDRFVITRTTPGDKYRVRAANAFLQAMISRLTLLDAHNVEIGEVDPAGDPNRATMDRKEPERYLEVFALVVKSPKEMLALYGGEHNHLPETMVQFLLAVDAIFLLSFLKTLVLTLSSKQDGPLMPEEVFNFETSEWAFHNELVFEIIKLENQVPLSLIRTVLVMWVSGNRFVAEESSEFRDLANAALGCMCEVLVVYLSSYLPGFQRDRVTNFFKDIEWTGIDHFMDLLYKVMCQPYQSLVSHQPVQTDQTGHKLSLTKIRHELMRLVRRGHVLRPFVNHVPVFKGSSRIHRMGGAGVAQVSDYVRLPSATQLQEAGIECRGHRVLSR